LEPAAEAFPGTMTTAAVTGFRVGRRPSQLRLRSVSTTAELDHLDGGRCVDWADVKQAQRWSIFVRSAPKPPAGAVELGELCRVHRGQVTGANRVWKAGPHSKDLPHSVLKPAVTRAAELFAAEPSLDDDSGLARIIDLPSDLDEVAAEYRGAVQRFIQWAESAGAASGYIARHRSPWWSVRLAEPPPIICTYMARRAPAFVRNRAQARLLNIAHGIYPREELGDEQIDRLLAALRMTVDVNHGRHYAGGLVKFEPRELERVLLPQLDSIPA
jgi:adenine-specific DNA-methyltransferase